MVEQNVLWFQIIMDDLLRKLMEVLYGVHDLPNQQLGLFFLNCSVLAKVVTQIRAIAVLQYSTEARAIDLNRIIQPNNVRMLEQFVY